MSDELPSNFTEWDRPSQLTYLELGNTRMDLLAHLRSYLGSDRGSPRLNKEEIAMICLDLEVLL